MGESSFESLRQTLLSFEPRLVSVISEVLVDEGISVHSITSRVKTEESAAEKLARKADRYSSVEQFTDLLGVRVTTYLADDVDRAALRVSREFDIDVANSIDKRYSHDPDRFGYLSLHYVATLAPPRVELTEYRRFAGLSFEIQIRSILQHAWAEIEHDLGYKADGVVPRDVRRKFSRMASMLEMVDEEFVSLRNFREQYKGDIRIRIRTEPDSLEIDQDTLAVALFEFPVFRDLDRNIAGLVNAKAESVDSSYLELRASGIRPFGIDRVSRLLSEASRLSRHIVEFANIFLDPESRLANAAVDEVEHFPAGIGMFYMIYCLAVTAPPDIANSWTGVHRSGGSADIDGLRAVWRQVVDRIGEPPAR